MRLKVGWKRSTCGWSLSGSGLQLGGNKLYLTHRDDVHIHSRWKRESANLFLVHVGYHGSLIWMLDCGRPA